MWNLLQVKIDYGIKWTLWGERGGRGIPVLTKDAANQSRNEITSLTVPIICQSNRF